MTASQTTSGARASQTFGQAASAYVSARPGYPPALFEWLAEIAPRRGRVWDCATGNGQAAVDLAKHFDHVIATDFSAGQIEAAMPAPNIAYSVQPAEHTDIAAATIDLVTVANALHWLDFDEFWPEVRRVAAPGAVFAAWGYHQITVSPEFDATVTAPFREIIAPFWARNNRVLWDGYKDAEIKFPFPRLPTPAIAIEASWTYAQILAFLRTWSAYRLSLANDNARAAMADLRIRIDDLYPEDQVFQVRMPLVMVAGKIL